MLILRMLLLRLYFPLYNNVKSSVIEQFFITLLVMVQKGQIDHKMLFQISWYKNGNVKLSTSDEIVITENDPKYSLKIEKLRERNFGLFSCRASSHLGTSEAAVEISGNVDGS